MEAGRHIRCCSGERGIRLGGCVIERVCFWGVPEQLLETFSKPNDEDPILMVLFFC